MANVFLTLEGLQHYDSKIKAVAGGSIALEGRTVILKSISGQEIGRAEIPQTVYDLATADKDGLLSASMFVKLEGVAEGATKVEASGTNGKLVINGVETNVYVHPTGASLTAGMYKISTDANGHVTTGEAITKADITGLGIPAQDTTYGEATQTTAGLMSAADKAKLDDVTEGATYVQPSSENGKIKIDGQDTTVYTHAAHNAYASGLYKVTVDEEGHVTAATAVAKADITGLGIPAQDTTYEVATADKDGLESSAHFTKVEGIEAGAQVNKIESISINGQTQTINSKGVNLDLSGYALKTDLVGLYNLKGSVDTYAALPTDAAKGDVYNVIAADSANGILAGDNVVWTGSEWDKLGGTFTVSGISNSDIDALFA